MKTFFTADLHFGHTNIIKYCNRPYLNADEMDEALISNWNKKVKPEDETWVVGDFCWKADRIPEILRRLNGKVNLLRGNHDPKMKVLRTFGGLGFVGDYKELYVNNQLIILMHYAMAVWNKSHHGAWHLYGHSHGNLPTDYTAKKFDIGVDCHNYEPLSFDEVKAIMANHISESLDHHGR